MGGAHWSWAWAFGPEKAPNQMLRIPQHEEPTHMENQALAQRISLIQSYIDQVERPSVPSTGSGLEPRTALDDLRCLKEAARLGLAQHWASITLGPKARRILERLL